MGFLGRGSNRTARGRAQLGAHSGLTDKGGRGGFTVTSAVRWKFELWVAPDNGDPVFLSHLTAWGSEADALTAGRWTYVRYDPRRADQCELDKDRLQQEFGPRRDGGHRLLIPPDVSEEWVEGMRANGRLTEAEFADARTRAADA
jgi:hypothetical protein